MNVAHSPKIIKTVREIQEISEHFRLQGKKIAAVFTMGYLHGGHAKLIEHAKSLADTVITTIFVNPTQFGPNEDFNRYPRDFEKDIIIASKAGADIIFHPEIGEMYPAGFDSAVEVEGASKILEGAFRPGHFKGVTTVVLKLLNITKPHIAIFGQKDAQQAFLVQKMVYDLNLDVKIVLAPIVRESDGLAMSSRNVYLDELQRKNALVLYRSLQLVEKLIQGGERSVSVLRKEMTDMIQSGKPTQIDYIAFINPETFSETHDLDRSRILVALAVRFGSTRLIDNTLITLK